MTNNFFSRSVSKYGWIVRKEADTDRSGTSDVHGTGNCNARRDHGKT